MVVISRKFFVLVTTLLVMSGHTYYISHMTKYFGLAISFLAVGFFIFKYRGILRPSSNNLLIGTIAAALIAYSFFSVLYANYFSTFSLNIFFLISTFLILITARLGEEHIIWLLKVLFWFQITYAIFEYAYPLEYYLDPVSGTWESRPFDSIFSVFKRLSGFAGNSNTSAALLCATFLALCSRVKNFGYFCLVLFVCVFMFKSRSSYGALLVSGLFVFYNTKYFFGYVLFLMLAFVLALLFYFSAPEAADAIFRLEALFVSGQNSFSTRATINGFAISQFDDLSILFGTGLFNETHFLAMLDAPRSYIESSFVKLYFEGGLLWLLLFNLFLLSIFYVNRGKSAAAFFIFYVLNSIFETSFLQTNLLAIVPYILNYSSPAVKRDIRHMAL